MKPIYAAAALIATTLPAFAQEEAVCLPTEEAEAALVDWYGETPVAGDVADGHLMWAAGIGQSWTLLSYEADGTSCTLAQGENWSPHLDSDALVTMLLADRGTQG